MKNAFKIGSAARIGIYVHWTFLVLLAGLFAMFLLRGASVGAAFSGLGLVLAVFGCVILHELGHALTARRFGIGTLDITMYPIGGVARLQGMPEEPMHELWISLAGPAVNVAIAAVLFVLNAATGRPLALEAVLAGVPSVLGTLMWLNLALAGFNMIPAFPMDGGRVLRAGLATQIGHRRATHIAALVGQTIAVGFAVFGLITFNLILVFIGLFVFAGARQEAQHVNRQPG